MNIRVPILPAKLHTCFKTANLSARNLSPSILKKQKTITPGSLSDGCSTRNQPAFNTKMAKKTRKNFQIKKNFVTLPLDKGSAPHNGEAHRHRGKMPEWSIGTVSKTVVPLRVPRVRIPVFPQKGCKSLTCSLFFARQRRPPIAS